jgi:hypothetical protein
MLVPARPFPEPLRRALERILRRARPRLDAPGIARIIDQLREADDVVTVLRAGPDPAANTTRLHRLSAAVKRLREPLEEIAAAGLLADAKARLRYDDNLESRMLEGLTMLSELITAARPKPRRPKGGRPPGGAALAPGIPTLAPRWFAAEVAAILRARGIQPSQHQDGLLADLLRQLWPHTMRKELPGDIRRLLRGACTE